MKTQSSNWFSCHCLLTYANANQDRCIRRDAVVDFCYTTLLFLWNFYNKLLISWTQISFKHSHLVQSIHVKWCGIEAISSLSIDVLWPTATRWNARSCTVVCLEPVTWAIDSTAHQFPLKCVPSCHVILTESRLPKELNNYDVNNHAITLQYFYEFTHLILTIHWFLQLSVEYVTQIVSEANGSNSDSDFNDENYTKEDCELWMRTLKIFNFTPSRFSSTIDTYSVQQLRWLFQRSVTSEECDDENQ